MTGSPPPAAPDRARAAAARGEWREAYDLLAAADAATPLDGAGLAALADAAYAVGHPEATIDAWERAYAVHLRAGDDAAAAGAAVRVALHLLIDTALMAPVRGWVARAERLLEGRDESPVHAWLAVARNYERLLSGDFESAREWARRAVDLGARHDPAAAAVGRIAEARSVIFGGDAAHGLALLEDAGVAAVSGELQPLHAGMVYCELVCALQAVMQYDLAEQWTAAMERWCRGRHVGSVHGRCRVHRAEILRLRGSLAEAEREALQACEELRPYLRRELGWPLVELGRIRLRRGDVAGAEAAFRAAHEVGWDPQPGLALVALARGDAALALRSIGDALAHPLDVPSKELPPHTELRRAPLLDAQVEIAVAAGDLAGARAAADDLARIAARFGSRALTAAAALAEGRVRLGEGDAPGARREHARAAQLWSEIGAPYEAAVARVELARAYRAESNEAPARLELEAARAAFERAGAAGAADGAARAAGGDGPPPAPRTPGIETPEPDVGGESVFRRGGDYWSIAYDGRTTRLRDLKGPRYLARLLAQPGRDLHVLDLVAGEHPVSGSPADTDGLTLASRLDGGAPLDARAKAAYRRRLDEIDEDAAAARALGDAEREAQAETERDFLVRELARAVGLGGRDRRVGSASERARASVTRAIRQAMRRIGSHHPALAAHLDRAVRTGTFCAYRPDPRLRPAWRL